jgi:hypothetical protein
MSYEYNPTEIEQSFAVIEQNFYQRLFDASHSRYRDNISVFVHTTTQLNTEIANLKAQLRSATVDLETVETQKQAQLFEIQSLRANLRDSEQGDAQRQETIRQLNDKHEASQRLLSDRFDELSAMAETIVKLLQLQPGTKEDQVYSLSETGITDRIAEVVIESQVFQAALLRLNQVSEVMEEGRAIRRSTREKKKKASRTN